MSFNALEAALQKLAASLARIEDAVESRVEGERANAGRDVEVQALSDDRARLAEELDQSFARNARLETANREVASRLDQAIETIRDMLGSRAQPH
jgi:hypothetical protein